MAAPIIRFLQRFLHLLARPVRGDRGRGGLVVQSFRGYGSDREASIMGHVYKQSGRPQSSETVSTFRDAIDVLRRLFRRGISGATVRVSFEGTVTETTTERGGFYRARILLDKPLKGDGAFLPVRITAVSGDETAETDGEIFIPPEHSSLVVISDIDDTVVYTGVANKIKMVWRLFMKPAESRTVFPGVAAFYRALHMGASGNEYNPMLYVSRGPWTIYDMLDRFFNIHRIPVGPILFLRDWGVSLHRPFPRRSKDHKLQLIREMLEIYHGRPFILIGDSGQHDPEIYAAIVHEHPGRVQAVYIRDIVDKAKRRDTIAELSREAAGSGTPMILAADSRAMAEHAVQQGFIKPDRLEDVEQTRHVAERTG